MLNKLKFYKNKKVFITGNSGFKGAWLAVFLKELGANVIGFSDKIKWEKSVFDYNTINNINQYWGDIRDYKKLEKAILENKPDFIFHLAAQPLVIDSYEKPFDTFTTNINGTLNLLDIIYKQFPTVPLIIVTSDKVYDNSNNRIKKFTEKSSLNGNCPYSISKVVCELLSNSYFSISKNMRVRTVRGGNVIGGGDWSKNRIVPDLVKSVINKTTPVLRNPNHTRPWSYVLDTILGYLLVGLDTINSKKSFDSFNIGSFDNENKTVLEVTKLFLKTFDIKKIKIVNNNKYLEKKFLNLDSTKAKINLSWSSMIEFNESIFQTACWYKRVLKKESPYLVTKDLIKDYCKLINTRDKIYA
ncbi:MAG: CDP-glucose 4,6-dehydratase [Alphaproteobacteria bacterium MarineAlpha9_Bin4]|nr:CDP-glucose 4,6-dehydratase [Pelagibacterales bacterium]PPR25070.1 MAG: CDP-glucose 4,6-dehydratase [Alphaproteobacteria bacterium MarineAlpha9_Bin4]|tara:strand:- start:271 stop:1341 length:1071 start_codon:yes stop_codon:yes gene_type:complete